MSIGFVFQPSFYTALRYLPAEDRCKVYDAVMQFAFERQEPTDLPDALMGYFLLIRPSIEKSQARYENGKKGGRPRKEAKKP